MAFSVEKMVCRLAYWLEEVRQDVCNVQSDVGELRLELDRLRAAVAHMERRERDRELAAQAALLREVNVTGRLASFERLVV
jgi:regulator of replication initiation timing